MGEEGLDGFSSTWAMCVSLVTLFLWRKENENRVLDYFFLMVAFHFGGGLVDCVCFCIRYEWSDERPNGRRRARQALVNHREV